LSNSKTLRAAIIGCGKIAGGYDESSSSDQILTHAKAYNRHPATELVAVADIDQKRAQHFARRWEIPQVYTDGIKMLEDARPDVVSICTPDDNHGEWLEACLRFPVRAVWCEKPLVAEEQQGARIVADYERRKIPLAVNYLRRWDPHLSKIRQLCAKCAGDDLKAIVMYGKGLHHNGSHAVDLLLDWFGEMDQLYPLDAINDYSDSDLTVSGRLTFKNGAQAYLIGNNERRYTLWEIDVIGPSWRFRLVQSGLRLEHYFLRDDPVFTGYKELDPAPEIITTDLYIDVYWALDNLVHAIHDGQALRSSGRTAFETLRVCELLTSKAQFLYKGE